MTRDGGTADSPLVAGRRNHEHSSLGGIIQGLLQLVFPSGRWLGQGRT